jgi:gamma-glutamyl hercynylcysteine S-oxide synthase
MFTIHGIDSAAATIESAKSPAGLIKIMRDFRARTLDLVADLDDKQLIGPCLPTVNPPLWEIGHVAWFQEFWVLRHLRRQKPLIENGDQLYNSTDVAHDTRWDLILPPRKDTLRYMDDGLNRVIDEFHDGHALSGDEFYFHLLATFHEGMHAEALAYTRQTLGYPAPRFTAKFWPSPEIGEGSEIRGGPCPGDVEIPGGTLMMGATADFLFVFDNEKWAHPVEIKPFKIARAPVTNAEFLAFVEDGGYQKKQFWSENGWNWLRLGRNLQLQRSFAKFFNKNFNELSEQSIPNQRLEHPMYWRKKANGCWQQRVFDQYVPLAEHVPVIHVTWYEAEAYCNWAGRRLPTETEWEIAASAEASRDGLGLGADRRHYPWGNDPPTPERANLDWRNLGLVEVGALADGDSAFGCRQMIGNIWEWTADDFEPYPGFTVDPYKEYSKPWFGTHKVLRGGCWATHSLLIRNTWRNFYTPDRNDVWAGFRTCAR